MIEEYSFLCKLTNGFSKWACNNTNLNKEIKAKRQSPSGLASLGHLPYKGRLFSRAPPAQKAPHNVGSWPSLRGLRGFAAFKSPKSYPARFPQYA